MNVIKMRREELGLTQQQLANKAGVSMQTISNYERGKDISGMSVRVAQKIAVALCVPMSYLMD